MKKSALTSLILALMLNYVIASEPTLFLKLEPSFRSIREGQSATLKLKISGSDVRAIIAEMEGINPKSPEKEAVVYEVGFTRQKKEAFVYEFDFKPLRQGVFTFGPYSISVNGQKLVSNQIQINVAPPWDGNCGTYFLVDKTSIIHGEDVELVIETWTTSPDKSPLIFKPNETFSLQNTAYVCHSSFHKNEHSEVRYSKISCLITPKESGEFRITKDLFKEFPDDIQPPDFTIMVKEKE